MYLAGHVKVLFSLVLFSSISVFGFPDGGPVDACVKPRPNQPYHGEARSQPLNTSPYKILASSSQYGPGSQVTEFFMDLFFFFVVIYPIQFIRTNTRFKSLDRYKLTLFFTIVGAPFKGFFVQARDTNTNKWIGSWTRTPNTNIHSECSAVTHADPHDKEQATFIWNAPADARGSVYFT
ncbi:hypothetical protein ALC62_07019 [Cyphomyrmex costatus]|uniref:Reelin domain-containing protein n=1 Tax=Cyphomyrmex costatus TaxID=456900 RepID=A0A195CNI7_9HYME|nr:hypothetical protein ALC62_07019 [Cyphomyrmex costatus]